MMEGFRLIMKMLGVTVPPKGRKQCQEAMNFRVIGKGEN